MVYTTIEQLPELRKKHEGKKIVFCSGCFDLTHAGHILFFEDCKKLGDILVVAVAGDKVLGERKGKGRPILSESIRLKTIDSLKPVDYCFIENLYTAEKPLFLLDMVFEKLKPDFYVINDDTFNIDYRKEVSKKFEVEMVILKRWCPPEFDNISTSKLIEKIKNI